MRYLIILLGSLLCAISFSTTLFTFPSQKGGQIITPSFAAVEGNRIRIGATDIRVTSLGTEEIPPDSSGRSIQPGRPTGIFKADGALIASAEISGADLLEDGYFWRSIAPIVLKANQEYFIGTLHAAGFEGQYIWNTSTAVLPPYAQDLGTWFKVSSTLEGGVWEASPPRHYTANFRAEAVPEPGSILGIVLGLGCVVRRRSRLGRCDKLA